MVIQVVRDFKETFLKLEFTEGDLYELNHIFEPDFHQEKYVNACVKTSLIPGAFQVGNLNLLETHLYRGRQPHYADDPEDLETLQYEGMIGRDGNRTEQIIDKVLEGKQAFDLSNFDGQIDIEAEESTEINAGNTLNVCALTSTCIRYGYIDLGLARSVKRSFYHFCKHRAGVQKNDVLVNSTGDGTIGRVAVYDFDFPAIVDGHITILHYKSPIIAWYVAAYLLSSTGQDQLYRYINGSSGQVELYPQDIARVWIKPATRRKMAEIGIKLRRASRKYTDFYKDIKAALSEL